MNIGDFVLWNGKGPLLRGRILDITASFVVVSWQNAQFAQRLWKRPNLSLNRKSVQDEMGYWRNQWCIVE